MHVLFQRRVSSSRWCEFVRSGSVFIVLRVQFHLRSGSDVSNLFSVLIHCSFLFVCCLIAYAHALLASHVRARSHVLCRCCPSRRRPGAPKPCGWRWACTSPPPARMSITCTTTWSLFFIRIYRDTGVGFREKKSPHGSCSDHSS
jgi:hypothetical protein